MGREPGGVSADVHPAIEHLVNWFMELTAPRRINVVAGLGGGAILPAAIDWSEIEAWSRLVAVEPSSWEVRMLRAMDDAWITAYNGKAPSQPQEVEQGLGEYCRGERIEECRKHFGTGLPTVCSTCPN